MKLKKALCHRLIIVFTTNCEDSEWNISWIWVITNMVLKKCRFIAVWQCDRVSFWIVSSLTKRIIKRRFYVSIHIHHAVWTSFVLLYWPLKRGLITAFKGAFTCISQLVESKSEKIDALGVLFGLGLEHNSGNRKSKQKCPSSLSFIGRQR